MEIVSWQSKISQAHQQNKQLVKIKHWILITLNSVPCAVSFFCLKRFSPKTMADAPGPHGLWWSGGVVRCTGYQWERRIRRPKGLDEAFFFCDMWGGREMMLFWKIWMVKFSWTPVKEVKMQSISLAYKSLSGFGIPCWCLRVVPFKRRDSF